MSEGGTENMMDDHETDQGTQGNDDSLEQPTETQVDLSEAKQKQLIDLVGALIDHYRGRERGQSGSIKLSSKDFRDKIAHGGQGVPLSERCMLMMTGLLHPENMSESEVKLAQQTADQLIEENPSNERAEFSSMFNLIKDPALLVALKGWMDSIQSRANAKLNRFR